MTKNMKPSRNKLPFLTGLRIIPAMMVVMIHKPIPSTPLALLTVVHTWYAAPTWFFVLSGFVITYAYYQSLKQLEIKNCWNYFVARMARIYPLYFFAILIFWLFAGQKNHLLPYLLAVQAWSLNFNTIAGILAPAWSVGVELFLYASFPLLAFAAWNLKILESFKKLIFIGLIILLFLISQAVYFDLQGRSFLSLNDPNSAALWIYFFPLNRLGDFILGMLGAGFYLFHSKNSKIKLKIWSYIIYGVIFIIIFEMVTEKYNHYASFYLDSAYAFPFIFLIIAMCMNPDCLFSRVLSLPIFVLLGELSYALYLIHPIAGIFLNYSLDFMSGLINYFFCIILLLSYAYGLHKLIEKPFNFYLRERLSFKKLKITVPFQPSTSMG